MKNYIRLFYNPLLAAGAVAGGAQTILGLVQSITGDKKMDKYLSQLKAYQTPQEIYDIVNATTARAGSGLSSDTLAYLTNQVDRGFGASVGAATRLGADPNDLSALLDQRVDATMKIGLENQLENLRNFDRYLQANELLANNKAAEFSSQQALIKDKLQAAQFNKESGLQNIAGGVNSFLSTLSASETMKLYKTFSNKPNILNSATAGSGYGSSGNSGTPVPGQGVIGGPSSAPGQQADYYTPEQIFDLLKRGKLIGR